MEKRGCWSRQSIPQVQPPVMKFIFRLINIPSNTLSCPWSKPNICRVWARVMLLGIIPHSARSSSLVEFTKLRDLWTMKSCLHRAHSSSVNGCVKFHSQNGQTVDFSRNWHWIKGCPQATSSVVRWPHFQWHSKYVVAIIMRWEE
jgi:hypothetical protein